MGIIRCKTKEVCVTLYSVVIIVPVALLNVLTPKRLMDLNEIWHEWPIVKIMEII